jgi:hypothetical protein
MGGATGKTDEVGAAERRALEHVARLSSGGPVDPRLRVTVNLTPDRPLPDGRTVLAGLADDGRYRSQFVTGISNGGLVGHPGVDRVGWERRIFGGAYDGRPPESRPVYGTLDVRGDRAGGAPRFGSAHLRLRADVLARCSFCYPDSVFGPTEFGVADRMGRLVALAAAATAADPLDVYVEAHVHGPVRLDRDVEAVVLDPSHRGTDVEADARRLPCPLEWHAGFRITADELRRHPDYRGARYCELGAELAVGGVLTPRILGEAWRTGRHDDQDLKRVWHLLARHGPVENEPVVIDKPV